MTTPSTDQVSVREALLAIDAQLVAVINRANGSAYLYSKGYLAAIHDAIRLIDSAAHIASQQATTPAAPVASAPAQPPLPVHDGLTLTMPDKHGVMKHLRLDLYQVNEHAKKVMASLGITYQHATQQSISDSWWFWNCENIPAELPACLKELKMAPHDAIGWGLSKEDADRIEAYRSAANGADLQNCDKKARAALAATDEGYRSVWLKTTPDTKFIGGEFGIRFTQAGQLIDLSGWTCTAPAQQGDKHE